MNDNQNDGIQQYNYKKQCHHMNDIQKNDIQQNNVRSQATAYNLTLLAFTDNIDCFNFNENMRLSVILPNVVAP
jgi:hypothetical protein